MTCSFEKVIRTLAFRGREKFDNSFFRKFLVRFDMRLGIYDLNQTHYIAWARDSSRYTVTISFGETKYFIKFIRLFRFRMKSA